MRIVIHVVEKRIRIDVMLISEKFHHTATKHRAENALGKNLLLPRRVQHSTLLAFIAWPSASAELRRQLTERVHREHVVVNTGVNLEVLSNRTGQNAILHGEQRRSMDHRSIRIGQLDQFGRGELLFATFSRIMCRKFRLFVTHLCSAMSSSSGNKLSGEITLPSSSSLL